MKLFLFLIILTCLLSGCSTPPVKNVNAANSPSVSNAVNNNAAIEMANTNAAPPTMEEFMNANSVAPAANSNNTDLSGNPMRKNLKGRIANPAPIDANARRILTVAPDNSEIFTEMNKQGTPIETRIFKSNPVLDRVERIFVDIKNPTIKVYLKNGKAFDLPKEKISDVFSASANDILKAVGVTPPNEIPAKKEKP